MTKALDALIKQFAERLDLGEGTGLLEALKTTAFKPAKVDGQYIPPTEGQLVALLVVANQYGLNPWTKEIYAFPDKHGGIIPVVGVDGWSRIINSNAQFDGIDFEQDADKCTCTIYRKDRNHPTTITEWMIECNRGGNTPWSTHPYRMLRHKATIQCARLAFGFVGIYEQDEAERIIDATTGEVIAMPTAAAMPKRASEVAALEKPTDPVVLEPTITPAAAAVPAQAEQATAPAPAASGNVATQAPAADTSDPATEGERNNVLKTAQAKKRDLGALLDQCGLSLDPATLTGLTKVGFKALKAAL